MKKRSAQVGPILEDDSVKIFRRFVKGPLSHQTNILKQEFYKKYSANVAQPG